MNNSKRQQQGFIFVIFGALGISILVFYGISQIIANLIETYAGNIIQSPNAELIAWVLFVVVVLVGGYFIYKVKGE